MTLDLAEEGVVADPEDADHGKAKEIAEGVVDHIGELVMQRAGGEIGAGHVDIQHEQRDRDREDAVAEGLEPGDATAIVTLRLALAVELVLVDDLGHEPMIAKGITARRAAGRRERRLSVAAQRNLNE